MFYCPIHKTDKGITKRIYTNVADWDATYCCECLKDKEFIDEVDHWFRNTNEKLSKKVKNQLKIKPVIIHQQHDFGYDNIYESLIKINYLDEDIVLLKLYQYGFGNSVWQTHMPLKWSLSLQTQRRCKTIDIDWEESGIPMHILDDSNMIRKALKKNG